MLLHLFPHLVLRWIVQVIFHPISILNLIPVLIVALYFIRGLIYAILILLERSWDGFCLTSLFLYNNRQHILVCAKMISFWVRKLFSMAQTHVFWHSPEFCGIFSFAWVEFCWCPFFRQVTEPKFLHQLGTTFNIYHYYRLAPGSYAECWHEP